MIRITPTSRPVNNGVPVGNVPAVTGTGCLRASEPAIASTSTIGRKRPPSIARPSVVLYQSVFPVRPPNAEPLLLAADVNAYTTSVRPWGPGFRIDDFGFARTTETEARARISVGTISRYRTTSFISTAWIFFPTYSGVRPTMRPAMKTARSAKIRIP